MKSRLTLTIVLSVALAAAATASPLIYHGNNPHITPTASPLNETGISNMANLTRPKAPSASANAAISESQLLKQSVVSGLSSTYLQLLTGSTSGNGTISFGDGSFADYSTVGGTRTVTFRNSLTGENTEISFPVN